MGNKNIFLIKYKMITVYGFHIDFQFRPYLTLLGGSQMVQSPRNHKNGLGAVRDGSK